MVGKAGTEAEDGSVGRVDSEWGGREVGGRGWSGPWLEEDNWGAAGGEGRQEATGERLRGEGSAWGGEEETGRELGQVGEGWGGVVTEAEENRWNSG